MKTMRHRTPDPDITEAQELALAALLAGATDEEAAKAAAVSRQTVNAWKNHDDGFAATLNRRREEVWEAHRDRLRALVGRAAAALEGALGSQDERTKLAAAMAVLKYGPADLAPRGPRTPRGIEMERHHRDIAEGF